MNWNLLQSICQAKNLWVYTEYQSESAMDSTSNADRTSTEAHAYSTSSSWIFKKRCVLVDGGRKSSILAGMPWHTSGNGKICHSKIFSRNMCMTTTQTKACNRYMHTSDTSIIPRAVHWSLERMVYLLDVNEHTTTRGK